MWLHFRILNVYLREAVDILSEGRVVHQSRSFVIVEDNYPILRLTLWLMMMHHHIKSSYERRRYFLDKAWTDGQSQTDTWTL